MDGNANGACLRAATHDQTQLPSADSVDQEQRRNGEHDLDSTVAERGEQGLLVRVVDSGEDRGTVEGDDWKSALHPS